MTKRIVVTPQGRLMERRRTPPPRAAVSAAKGAGTAGLTLAGILLPTFLAWLADPTNVTTVLHNFPINPIYVPLIVALSTGVAKFGWDYLSRKVKSNREAA